MCAEEYIYIQVAEQLAAHSQGTFLTQQTISWPLTGHMTLSTDLSLGCPLNLDAVLRL